MLMAHTSVRFKYYYIKKKNEIQSHNSRILEQASVLARGERHYRPTNKKLACRQPQLTSFSLFERLGTMGGRNDERVVTRAG